MKVTVCQLPENRELMPEAIKHLQVHLAENHSDFLLLPEMPFDVWLARDAKATSARWLEASEAHRQSAASFKAHPSIAFAGTHPIHEDGNSYNEAFYWDRETGFQPGHRKYYLPEEPGFWEASWYQRGPKSFEAMQTARGVLGFLICSELWFTEWARVYARQGVHLLLCPRATGLSSKEKWVVGGRAAAVMAGAYCLSSNRSMIDENGFAWGGAGWVISPDGDVLAITSDSTPFQTVELDLGLAEKAKTTYPRYIPE